ncbi:MAG: hypothetical protein K6G07_02385 [Lachnospiraceae bacterium]|nr:hypothetical protein [Lachnospiraceae bacterium]
MDFLPLQQLEKEKYEIKTNEQKPAQEEINAQKDFLDHAHKQMEENEKYQERQKSLHATEEKQKEDEKKGEQKREKKAPVSLLTEQGREYLRAAERENSRRQAMLLDQKAFLTTYDAIDYEDEKEEQFLKGFFLYAEKNEDGNYMSVEDEAAGERNWILFDAYRNEDCADRIDILDMITDEYIRLGASLSLKMLDADYITTFANDLYLTGQRLQGMEYFLADKRNQNYLHTSPKRYDLLNKIHDLGSDFMYLATRVFEGHGVDFMTGKEIEAYGKNEKKAPEIVKKELQEELDRFRPTFESHVESVRAMQDEYNAMRLEMKQKKQDEEAQPKEQKEGQTEEKKEEKIEEKAEEKKTAKVETTSSKIELPVFKTDPLLISRFGNDPDTASMTQVKESYKELLRAFHNKLPGDEASSYRAQQSIVSKFHVFDTCCQIYINTHHPLTPTGWKRLRLVKEAKKRMLQQIRSFYTYQKVLRNDVRDPKLIDSYEMVINGMKTGSRFFERNEKKINAKLDKMNSLKGERLFQTIALNGFCFASIKQANANKYGYFADNAMAEWLDKHLNEKLIKDLIAYQLQTALELSNVYMSLLKFAVPSSALNQEMGGDTLKNAAKYQYALLLLRGTGVYRKYLGLRYVLDYVFKAPNRIEADMIRRLNTYRDTYLEQCRLQGDSDAVMNISQGESLFRRAESIGEAGGDKEVSLLDDARVMEVTAVIDWKNELTAMQTLEDGMTKNAFGDYGSKVNKLQDSYKLFNSPAYEALQDFGSLRVGKVKKGKVQKIPDYDRSWARQRRQEELDRRREEELWRKKEVILDRRKPDYMEQLYRKRQEEEDLLLALQLSEQQSRENEEDYQLALALQLSLAESEEKKYQERSKLVYQGSVKNTNAYVREKSFQTDKTKEPVIHRLINGRQVTVLKYDPYTEPANFEEAYRRQQEISVNIDVDAMKNDDPIKVMYLQYCEKVKHFRIEMGITKRPEELVYQPGSLTSVEAMNRKKALLEVPGKSSEEFRFVYENLTDDEKALYKQYHADYERLLLAEAEREKIVTHPARPMKHHVFVPAANEVLRTEYERQHPLSNDCWSCSGSGVLNYFTANDPKRKRVTAEQFRGFQPHFVEAAPGQNLPEDFGKYKYEVNRITTLNQSKDRTLSPMGNPYQLADLFLDKLSRTDTLKNASVRHMTFNVAEANMRVLTRKDTHALHNLQMKFMDVIKEALDGGSAVSILVGLHYMTIVGIEGDKLKLHNSASGSPGVPETMSIGSILEGAKLVGGKAYLNGSATVEIMFLQKEKDPAELTAKYSGLHYDANARRYSAERDVINAENVAHVNGVEAHLDRMQMDEDLMDLYTDSIYLPKQIS